jgi:hypothetical protein
MKSIVRPLNNQIVVLAAIARDAVLSRDCLAISERFVEQ